MDNNKYRIIEYKTPNYTNYKIQIKKTFFNLFSYWSTLQYYDFWSIDEFSNGWCNAEFNTLEEAREYIKKYSESGIKIIEN